MKKIIIALFLLLFVLTGCMKGEIKVYSDEQIDEFNKVLENVGNGKTKAYDLRTYEECYAGRIPGFYCARVDEVEDEQTALDKIITNLSLLLGDKKNHMIILVDNADGNASYVASKLFEKGYKNVHYFENGYTRYVQLQKDFIPETGECDC